MEETEKKTSSLREIRERKPAKSNWFRRHCPWLFSWQSTFYYGVFLFLLGMGWTAYSLYTDSFTQMLNWDYTWQYISFTYDYWEVWHRFFTTGRFTLYDGAVYLGTDMIGSGSYYGLFDPFMFICYIFPRAWIPQMYAQMTFAKLMVGGLFMRCYLKNMGIKEWTARIGGLIYAFSGFTTFFEGSPNFTSAMAFFPLILWGIELVIKERKPTCLILGVFFLGLSCFFYVPVLCIFGVMYALWRFFMTIKTRDKKQNGMVMVLGVCGFAIGIMMSSFTLLPSLRQTSLSGRSSSIGTAYLHSVLAALKQFDFRLFFTLVFEEVGDSPGRELMGLISFFFPTGGWTQLPLARGTSYDAWTASLFCYTPCVILFFAALIHSVRLKKWSHFVVVLLCAYAVFTNFSYFFFYAFSGNGYGRWYLVLIPLIVYYCCWAFDQRDSSPRFIPFAATLLALAGTIFTFYFTERLLKGKTFTYAIYNTNGTTYWVSTYHTASESYNGVMTAWYFYYQLAFVVIEGVLLCVGYRKQWLKYALFGMVAVEAVVMGNLSYAFNGTWSYENSFAGGRYNAESSLYMGNAINSHDSGFFRVHSDTFQGSNYFHNVAGLNTPSAFHSLMNFDLETFAINNQMKYPGDERKTYNEEYFYNPNWSGFYGNKRYSTDTLLGMRYYIVANNYSGWKDDKGESLFLPPNVPFHAEEMPDYSPNRKHYRVYRRDESSMMSLGYAVNSDLLYRMGNVEGSHYENAFYRRSGESYGTGYFRNLEWNQYVELNGAIIDDDVKLPETFNAQTAPEVNSDAALRERTGISRLSVGMNLGATYYVTAPGDGLLPSSDAEYANEGLAYFINHYQEASSAVRSGAMTIKRDLGKLAFYSYTGDYLNEDPNGCYIEFRFYNDRTSNNARVAPRVYAIGDTFDESGNRTATNVCLSFDNMLLDNASKTDYYSYRSCTFGLYAKGRVRYFVFCYGGGGSITVYPYNFYMAVHERSEIEAFEEYMRNNALQNVTTDTNVFRFQTAYAEDRIVLTQLGYDKGWTVKATMPDGKKTDCQVLRLDGGLVGFVAPHALDENGSPATVNYEMRYVTLFSGFAVALWTVGVVMFATILTLQFLYYVKPKKKATVPEA